MNLLTIAKHNDDTYARRLLNYPTYDEALAALYTSLASAIANENVSSYTAELITDEGRVIKCERYVKTITLKEVE